MAAPPTITENNALFLARQRSLKRSQRTSPKFLRLLGEVWAATKTSLGGRVPSPEKRTAAVLNTLRPIEPLEKGKIVTVLRTVRRPGFTPAKQRNGAARPPG